MPDLRLEYERVEPRETTDGPSPAAFVLHGRGADEKDLLPIARRLPDALDVFSLRAPDRAVPGYSWYGIDLGGGSVQESQPEPESFRRSLDLVGGFVGGAVEDFDLDPGRLGLFGFSQGAVVSFALLLDRPERYSWCVGLHGHLPASHAALTPEGIEGKPVFVGAGSADDLVPAARGERAVDRLRELGCDVEFGVYGTGHGVGREELGDVVSWVGSRVR